MRCQYILHAHQVKFLVHLKARSDIQSHWLKVFLSHAPDIQSDHFFSVLPPSPEKRSSVLVGVSDSFHPAQFLIHQEAESFGRLELQAVLTLQLHDLNNAKAFV